MKLNIISLALGSLALTTSAFGAEFTLSTGYPFVAQLQASHIIENGDARVYANYKVGLDDGFSGGYERAFGDHSIGVMYGALGARKTEDDCEQSNPIVGSLCGLGNVFGDRTTNGFGVTYQYWFNGAFKPGWGIRFEGGYGDVTGTDEKRADGNVTISYQF